MADPRECGQGLPQPKGGFGAGGGAASGSDGGTRVSVYLNGGYDGALSHADMANIADANRLGNENRQLYALQQTIAHMQNTINQLTTTVNNLSSTITNINTGDNTQTIRQIALGIANDAVALGYVAVWVPFRE